MAKQPTVLICGGSGLIGTRLQEILRSKGYRVTLLSRSKTQGSDRFYWDPAQGFLNIDALNANHIVNLAGAGVADKKWSAKRKAEIIDSRVDSADILYKKLTEQKSYPQSYISASAIGYYGDRGDEMLTEDARRGDGFLAETTERWERAADQFQKLKIRTVKLRIGVVLAQSGGALEKLSMPVRWMAGAPLGSGKQYMSWIHIEDMCRMIVAAIENKKWTGVVNGVAPEPVTNREMTERIAKMLDKPLILPNVPEFALRLAMGEMADIVLESTRVSCEKAQNDYGFKFSYGDLDSALRDLLRDKNEDGGESANDGAS
ncbi:MAG: TIGR01777 family oxidoreductase [bacterium]|nr:TIGR01777 family oxidoreductase [bacterium]